MDTVYIESRQTFNTLSQVADERVSQDNKWGEQSHPDGTGGTSWETERDGAIASCGQAFAAGSGTWRHILEEETAEAYAESDLGRLRAELIQVAAVAVAWIEDIDRRAS